MHFLFLCLDIFQSKRNSFIFLIRRLEDQDKSTNNVFFSLTIAAYVCEKQLKIIWQGIAVLLKTPAFAGWSKRLSEGFEMSQTVAFFYLGRIMLSTITRACLT